MPSSCLLRLPDIITFRLCMQCYKSVTFIRYYATTGRKSLNFTQKVVPPMSNYCCEETHLFTLCQEKRQTGIYGISNEIY